MCIYVDRAHEEYLKLPITLLLSQQKKILEVYPIIMFKVETTSTLSKNNKFKFL